MFVLRFTGVSSPHSKVRTCSPEGPRGVRPSSRPLERPTAGGAARGSTHGRTARERRSAQGCRGLPPGIGGVVVERLVQIAQRFLFGPPIAAASGNLGEARGVGRALHLPPASRRRVARKADGAVLGPCLALLLGLEACSTAVTASLATQLFGAAAPNRLAHLTVDRAGGTTVSPPFSRFQTQAPAWSFRSQRADPRPRSSAPRPLEASPTRCLSTPFGLIPRPSLVSWSLATERLADSPGSRSSPSADDWSRLRSGFVHLHVHSNFSFGDGACRIDELVDAARALGMKALARHRPRGALRSGALLRGLPEGRHQADRRRRADGRVGARRRRRTSRSSSGRLCCQS